MLRPQLILFEDQQGHQSNPHKSRECGAEVTTGTQAEVLAAVHSMDPVARTFDR